MRFKREQTMKNLRLIYLRYSLLLVAVMTFGTSFAQTDSLIFSNGEMVIGEIKSMDRGIITIETFYSDSDFKIEWDRVTWVRSTQGYLVTLADGRRFNASINSTANDDEIALDNGVMKILVPVQEIVDFKPIDDAFWDKISANIDLGLNITKANNLVQFNMRSYLAYLTKHWEISGTYNNVFSSQDSVANTRRMDANINFKVFLPKAWYVFYGNDFLQNDEQKLALRSTSKIGAGNYIVKSNKTYLGVFGGLSYNYETYTENADPDRKSTEFLAGLELNLFDIGDLSLLTNAIVYPNLTESGRVRFDFRFDLKYDLPMDFYIKTGTTLNFDNRPVAGAGELDYVIQTGIGWEW